jgi:hypothetical protein
MMEGKSSLTRKGLGKTREQVMACTEGGPDVAKRAGK